MIENCEVIQSTHFSRKEAKKNCKEAKMLHTKRQKIYWHRTLSLRFFARFSYNLYNKTAYPCIDTLLFLLQLAPIAEQ